MTILVNDGASNEPRAHDGRRGRKPIFRSPSESTHFFVGQDRQGNWVVRDDTGLCGGLFVSRTDALRFAMLENASRPRAVVMVPGAFELGAAFRKVA